MFNQRMFLGQVPLNLGQAEIRPGTGFQPGPIYWPGGYGAPQQPTPGGPMTREIIAPGGWSSTQHCYQMPDGSYRSLTMDQAASMEAAGVAVAAVDNRQCAGAKAAPPSAAVMAGRHLGQNGGPSNGGAPTVSVAPAFHNGGFNPHQVEFAFWHQGWPQYPYPQAYPNPNQRLVCRKLDEESEDEGREVMECRYEPVAQPAPVFNAPVVTYPVMRVFPFF